MGEQPKAGPGRPRSRRADRAILEASLDLLAEVGYGGLTMEGIAGRAGVGKATLYRRWKSTKDVVVAAVSEFVEEIVIPDSGSVEEDLRRLMRRAIQVYRGRFGKLMPGLVAAMTVSPEVARAVRERFLAGRRAALSVVLERGVARGELRADVNVEIALDFLGGPLFYRLLVTGASLDEAFAEEVVSAMLGGIASAGPAGGEEKTS